MKQINRIPDIDEEFLTSNYSKFILEYEIELIKFTERLRHYEEEFEKPKYVEELFLKSILKFLVSRNTELLNYEDEQKLKQEFSKKESIDPDVLEYITTADHDKDLTKEERKISLDFSSYYWEDYEQNKEKYEEKNRQIDQYNYKIHFLSKRAESIGFSFINAPEGITFNEIKNETSAEPVELPSHLTGPEKMIILEELGILEFLEDKLHYLSQNKISKILKLLTGNHVQDRFSALRKEGKETPLSNNNPYFSEKTQSNAKERLVNLGVKLSKLD